MCGVMTPGSRRISSFALNTDVAGKRRANRLVAEANAQ
jgi:hypothetical protein